MVDQKKVNGLGTLRTKDACFYKMIYNFHGSEGKVEMWRISS
jgi:hypothetical protein